MCSVHGGALGHTLLGHVYTFVSQAPALKQPDSDKVGQALGESQHSLALLENSTALTGNCQGRK